MNPISFKAFADNTVYMIEEGSGNLSEKVGPVPRLKMDGIPDKSYVNALKNQKSN